MKEHVKRFVQCLVTTIVLGPPVGFVAVMATRWSPNDSIIYFIASLPSALGSYLFVPYAAIAGLLIAAVGTVFAPFLSGVPARGGMAIRVMLGAIVGALSGALATAALANNPSRMFIDDTFFVWASIYAGAFCGAICSSYFPGSDRRITWTFAGVLCGVFSVLVSAELGYRAEAKVLVALAVTFLAISIVRSSRNARHAA
jgi:hypothetical protein